MSISGRTGSLGLPRDDGKGWRRRQSECDNWYAELARDASAAAACFRQDYRPYAELLGSLRGGVLDVGGGSGVTRHYLREDVRYVCVEPSSSWLEADWSGLAESFPCLATRPRLVRAVGERLPFRSRSFDAALALWTFNHVQDPAAVMSEIARVLRPGGRLFLVLEDMAPSWTDFLRAELWTVSPRASQLLRTKLRCTLARRRWPVQTDHLALLEADLVASLSRDFELARRAWTGGYLSYEARVRREASPAQPAPVPR